MYGGTQQISERMARLLGDCVHLGCPVSKIVTGDQNVLVTDSGGTEYKVMIINITVLFDFILYLSYIFTTYRSVHFT